MKRIFLFFLFGFFFAFLQASIFPRFLPEYAKPDLFILLIVYLSLSEKALRGGILAWILGLLKDTFAGQTFGLHGFVFLITFFLIKGTERRLNTESSILLVLLVFLGTFLERGLTAATLLILADAGSSWQEVLRQLPVQALVGPTVACLLLLGVRWIYRRTSLQRFIPGLRYIDNRYEP